MSFRNYCIQQAARDDDYGKFCREFVRHSFYGWVGVQITWPKVAFFVGSNMATGLWDTGENGDPVMKLARRVWIDYAARDL